MSKSWPLNLRRKLVTFRGRSDTVSERAKRLLVKTLYTQPSTLAIGAFNGVASTAIAAWVSRLDILYLGCVVLTLIAAARIVTALKLAREEEHATTRKLEIAYEAGAFSYALVF